MHKTVWNMKQHLHWEKSEINFSNRIVNGAILYIASLLQEQSIAKLTYNIYHASAANLISIDRNDTVCSHAHLQ